MAFHRFLFIIVVSMSTSSLLVAHGGHGHTDGDTIAHYLNEPVHIIAIVLMVAVLAGPIALRYLRNRSRLGEVE